MITNMIDYGRFEGRNQLLDCVDVRIRNVKKQEIESLTLLLDAMRSPQEYAENVVNCGRNKNYVVTVKTGRLQPLKDALRAVLRVVNAERIDIEPWDGPSQN